MKTVEIFGVRIHDVDQDAAMARLKQALRTGPRCLTVTPNPEILLQAAADPSYRALLNRADLAVPDGRGLRFGSPLRQTTPGADLARELLVEAGRQRLRVLAVVRPDGLSSAAEVRSALQTIAPQASIAVLTLALDAVDRWDRLEAAAALAPAVVFVGLGFPYQEAWLLRRASHIPTLKAGIAIGGTFDYWTGQARRAPAWWRQLGLEWLWRLAGQPRRWRRIFRAVVVFPLRVCQARWSR